jgi:predicted RNase H-like HicB family nuclease
MPHYIALVHKDKTSAFGVQFPDVPGCFSAADDMDDLVANAMEALSLWAEDETLPAPRSIEALKKDKFIAGELAEGAFLVSVLFCGE